MNMKGYLSIKYEYERVYSLYRMNMKGYTVYKYEYERVYSLESFHEFCNFYNVSRNI